MAGALRELLAKFVLGVEGQDKIKSADKSVNAFASTMKKAGAMIAGGIIIGEVKSQFLELKNLAAGLDDASQRLGINASDLQSWQFAAKLSGVEAEGFNSALKKMQKNSADAATSGAVTGGAFKDLGVHLREDTNGPMRDSQEIMYDTGIAISQLKDPAERTQAAMKVFGKSGADLIPMFSQGEKGLKALLGEVDALGGGLSGDAIKQLAAIDDEMDRFDMATLSVKSAFVVEFFPAIRQGLEWLVKLAVGVSKSETAMHTIKLTAAGVGLAIAGAGAAAIIPWLPLIATFAGLLLVLDDLRAGVQGHKSVISGLLDKLYGQGMGKSFFTTIREEWNALMGDLKGKSIDEVLDTLVSKFEAAGKRAAQGFVHSLTKPLNDAMHGIFDAKGGAADEEDVGFHAVGLESDDKAIQGAHYNPGGAANPTRTDSQKVGAQSGASSGTIDNASLIRALAAARSEESRSISAADAFSINKLRTNDPNASVGDLKALVDHLAKGDKTPKTISLTSQATITVQSASDDPASIGSATKGAVDQAMQGSLNAVRRYTDK